MEGGHAPPPTQEAGDSDTESDSGNSSELSPTNPPTHLLQLFDNGLLTSFAMDTPAVHRSVSSQLQAEGISILLRLMPSRNDMLVITEKASSWLSLYNSLFPFMVVTKTSDEMLAQYDKLQDPGVDLVTIAALLLSVALTVQQAPDDTTGHAAQSIKMTSSFVKDISDTVERIFVSDDTLVGTFEGIETAMLFLRLQLGRSKVRKMWLLLRRLIALAELIGLPRASMALAEPGPTPPIDGQYRQKAAVWQSICAVDRITSIMWSLPLATAHSTLPKHPLINSEGQVSPQAYLYNLADIARRVLEQDTTFSSGRRLTELFNAVQGTDQELRSLAGLTPKSWWKVQWSELLIDAPLQYWHQYLTVRAHLQLALTYDEDQRFAFNFFTCFEACQELARRYVPLRQILPAGFFANRVIDLQAFTAAIFLLLASYRTARGSGAFQQAADVDPTLVDQVVQMMEYSATRAGGDFAHQAANAIRSLRILLQQPQMSASQKITLNLPFAGKIHVSRKSYATESASTTARLAQQLPPRAPWRTHSSDGPNHAPETISSGSPEVNMINSLSYSMELQEDYSFLTDEAWETEQWFTWSEMDSNG